jgi:hypothetical protein
MSIGAISSANAAYAAQAVQPAVSGSGSVQGGSKAPANSSSVGPAVILSLSNTGGAKAPDAAQGDPDHDGK